MENKPEQTTLPQDGSQPWERKILESLVRDVVKEQRAKRRWGIFFKLLGFAYLLVPLLLVLGLAGSQMAGRTTPHTAVVRLEGVIAPGSVASADNINAALRRAFEDPNTKGVVLLINSPGGSPVQAGIIHDEIRRLRKLHPGTPLYAVVEDLCASGGYYVAVAADRIYVDKASLVGSIGVLMDGFGFTGAMEKLGVERRLFTAGENKGFLDPFSPMNDKQKAYVTQMLADIHQQFIDVVRKGRGARLKETPDMFSGLVWHGAKSIELGLTDALGTTDSVAREVIKADQLVDYTLTESLADRVAKRLGTSFSEGVTGQTESVRLR
ncbi:MULTISPECIES: S49 family peptidase [Leeia]|uniref:S49 family peptidase n=1 Tax=Leeia aquatica TaxID=2725557 RepID=A0A847S4F1_9NEIS|nr:S49 family peptidase [Leeia aquatica]NLR74654.1 S49 family peptidase [Leeia aquatica]